MATAKSQKKWRDKHRYVKSQLNVMARKQIHDYLDDIAWTYALKGKGEAVTFACYATKALMQRADEDPLAARLLEGIEAGYRRDRDMYAAGAAKGDGGGESEEDWYEPHSLHEKGT